MPMASLKPLRKIAREQHEQRQGHADLVARQRRLEVRVLDEVGASRRRPRG